MALQTRIAVTFLLLLTAVLAAALGAVSAANRGNAEREVERQLDVGASVFSRLLETNRRQLTQAAQAVAADYGFREAVATRDTDTLESSLENSGRRIGAAMVVLTALNGDVIASSGANLQPGAPFPISAMIKAGDSGSSMMVDHGRIYQLVAVSVRSPLPVAWIAMGFELDDKAAGELADITGLSVTLAVRSGDQWTDVIRKTPRGQTRTADVATRRIELSNVGQASVVAILSRSLAEARAPFERLTDILFIIAGVSLVAFALAAFWIARTITRPLQDLTQVVSQMRAGSYNVAVHYVQRHDELGVLADGLRLMQTAVQSRDQSIRRLAYEDGLTGLMNRVAFGAALTQALETARSQPVAVAVINLHRFRRINEHLGYSVGDAVLIKMAERLGAVPSINAAVARLAADQFAAFTTLRNGDTPQSWGNSLLVALSDPVHVETQPIDISATLGLAQTIGNTMSADELMRCADLALECARREKRPLSIYEPALKPAALVDQLSLLGELRRAVEQDQFVLYFQPKIEFATERVAGAEVLLRWQHPTRGLLAPVEFIPFAEQTGFIRRLTRWTLNHAIEQAARWHAAGSSLCIAVNISAEDLSDPRFDSRVAALLTRHQLPPSLLTLELTESGFIEDPTRALQVLNALASLGIGLSIDDFGTGYSSLSHLARMPVNEVKIDSSFVRGLEADPEFVTVVKSAIDMGHGLGLKVVAEGIETEAAASVLRELSCDIAQGYLYARPMPRAVLEIWLQGKARVPVIAIPAAFTVDDVSDTLNLATY